MTYTGATGISVASVSRQCGNISMALLCHCCARRVTVAPRRRTAAAVEWNLPQSRSVSFAFTQPLLQQCFLVLFPALRKYAFHSATSKIAWGDWWSLEDTG